MVGIGIGTIFAVTSIPLQASVKHVDDKGPAAGTLVIFRLFGALISLTISSTVFNSSLLRPLQQYRNSTT